MELEVANAVFEVAGTSVEEVHCTRCNNYRRAEGLRRRWVGVLYVTTRLVIALGLPFHRWRVRVQLLTQKNET